MTGRLPVRVPRDVQTWIFNQVLYIANDSVDNALNWESRIRATLDTLGGFHGHAVGEDASDRSRRVLRKTVFEGTYLIHYHVDEAAGEIIIAGIRHGAMLPDTDKP